jgi:hypothetical protein
MILGFVWSPFSLEQVHDDVLDEVQVLQHGTKYCTQSEQFDIDFYFMAWSPVN